MSGNELNVADNSNEKWEQQTGKHEITTAKQKWLGLMQNFYQTQQNWRFVSRLITQKILFWSTPRHLLLILIVFSSTYIYIYYTVYNLWFNPFLPKWSALALDPVTKRDFEILWIVFIASQPAAVGFLVPRWFRWQVLCVQNAQRLGNLEIAWQLGLAAGWIQVDGATNKTGWWELYATCKI